jgi:hypothetical protein
VLKGSYSRKHQDRQEGQKHPNRGGQKDMVERPTAVSNKRSTLRPPEIRS